MHRTEGTNHFNHMFVDGPPGTVLEKDWLNSVQEEIARVIEECGESLLSAGTDTRDQLWTALRTGGIRFDSGTVTFWWNNSAPTGWTKKTDWPDMSMMVYTTGNISQAGTVDPRDQHTHPINVTTDPDPSSGEDEGSGSNTNSPRGHTHVVVGNTENNTAPKYILVIAATKD